ncbi:MAG: hypothetical protein M1817_006802 [Caeruleum heppii]|nr:MAG: hypothetical protein M1817_006802 [Caeruleum heppii]
MADTALPFEDLDLDDGYTNIRSSLLDPQCQNLVVDVTNESASAASNLEPSELETLTLARQYGFSPRLTALMCSPPLPPGVAANNGHLVSYRHRLRDRVRGKDSPASGLTRSGSSKLSASESSGASSVDVEKDLSMSELSTPPNTSRTLELGHYALVSEVWHYCSVDWGNKYLCLGYNTLHIMNETESVAGLSNRPHDVPRGRRLWSWLVLCEDNTVMSIHEDPLAHVAKHPHNQLSMLQATRRNLLNVFRHISKAPAAMKDRNALSILNIRENVFLDSAASETHYIQNIACSLFYYLFDDWYADYGLVARKEHQYGAELEILRQKMMDKAELEDLETLHHIGRQLAVLKRMHESYRIMIDRILEKQKPTISHTKVDVSVQDKASSRPSLLRPHSASRSEAAPVQATITAPSDQQQAHHVGVSLSPAAIVRFERLRDNISLYAMSEIQDCLDEKESMVLMTVNMVNMKESQAVERLTRTTILLTMLTLVFLPVSLLTAYFSTQIDELRGKLTLRAYWVSFGVIVGSSCFVLALFAQSTGTVTAGMINGFFIGLLGDIWTWVGRTRRRLTGV